MYIPTSTLHGFKVDQTNKQTKIENKIEQRIEQRIEKKIGGDFYFYLCINGVLF